MTLKETLNQLKERRAEAAIDPVEADPKVRAGVEAISRNAKAEIPKLAQEYAAKIERIILLINVTGAGAKKFAQYAHDKMKVLSYDYTGIVKVLADSVRARGGSESFGTNEGALLLSELLNLKESYLISNLPTLRINETVPTPYEAPLEEAIERVLEFSYGIGFYDAVTLRQAQSDALQSEFSGNVLPIVVYNYKGLENRGGALLQTPSFQVDAPFSVSVEFVKNALLKIKSQLKQGKETNTNPEAPSA
jgi:hypothetical protein